MATTCISLACLVKNEEYKKIHTTRAGPLDLLGLFPHKPPRSIVEALRGILLDSPRTLHKHLAEFLGPIPLGIV